MADLSLREAKEIIHSLSRPSKMPGYAWSLPAQECNVGSILADIDGSICSTCYAMKGRYSFANVRNALYKRLESLKNPLWEDAMVRVLSSEAVRKHGYFRWFDSGDLQSVDLLRRICNIAERTPFLKHWMPTREYRIVRDFLESGGSVPDNLLIRLSAPMIDGPAPAWWPWTSAVHREKDASGQACPAPQQGNECRDCRACWDKEVPHVSYHYH